MRETYNIIRGYLLNGVFAYSLFGIYALTISPIATQFFNYGVKNVFIAIFGFVMLIAEFFALNFKLKMVRMRSEEKRIAYKKETGIDIIPSVNPVVFFGFLMRIVFHVSIIMVSMTALGYTCTEQLMCKQAIIVIMVWLLADVGGCFYIYVNSNFYSDAPQTKQDLNEDLKEENDWYATNLPITTSVKYFRLEILSDIVLQVYALMLFTSFWKYINQTGIEMLNDSMFHHESATDAASVFLMLFAFVIVGLMPMRIAYWIEDSLESFTSRDKLGTAITFFIVAIFTCSPAIIKFISLFILHKGVPAYLEYVLPIALFLILLIVQIILFGRKDQKIKQE